MLLDLKFSIGTLGIGSGTLFAGLYGMNLKNFIEESEVGFLGISSLSFAFAALICYFGLIKLRRVQRLSMYGNGEVGRNRASWNDVDSMHMIGDGRIDKRKRLRGVVDSSLVAAAAAQKGEFRHDEALSPAVAHKQS